MRAGGSTAATNQQPSTPLRMPPIQKQNQIGGNYSLHRQLPSDHIKNQSRTKNMIANQGNTQGGHDLSIVTTINHKNNKSKMCMMGTPLLANHKNTE